MRGSLLHPPDLAVGPSGVDVRQRHRTPVDHRLESPPGVLEIATQEIDHAPNKLVLNGGARCQRQFFQLTRRFIGPPSQIKATLRRA